MNEVYPYLLTIASSIIGLLLIIIGFFLVRLVSDVKSNTLEIGKNKGNIELIAQRQASDVNRLEQTVQLEIKALSKEVNGLTHNVNNLVVILGKDKKDKDA